MPLRLRPRLRFFRPPVPVSLPRTISPVATSVTALVGTAPRGDAPTVPTQIRSLSDFDQRFGDAGAPVTHLALAVKGFFDNGGQQAVILNRGPVSSPVTTAELAPLAAMSQIALIAAPGITDPASHDALMAHCERSGDRFAVLDTPHTVADIAAYTETAPAGVRPRQSDGGFAAVYAPWIDVPSPMAAGGPLPCPPSGHVCGIYARTDAARGVHKTSANTPVHGALGPTRIFTQTELAALAAAHVNPLRALPHGFRVWGGRTLAASSGAYRYIAVRRLALMLRQSIVEGTQWAVHEPNGHSLWRRLRQVVDSFMANRWRQGAFPGQTARDAFFVRCDASTTTQADIDQRRANLLVGFAPLRPAEFLVMEIAVSTGW